MFGLLILTLAWMIFGYVIGVIVGGRQEPVRQWCVFDPDAPDENQIIVTARTADEALGKAAHEVFNLQVEEV